eukprot:UN02293
MFLFFHETILHNNCILFFMKQVEQFYIIMILLYFIQYHPFSLLSLSFTLSFLFFCNFLFFLCLFKNQLVHHILM